ncbi:MAG: pyridoxal-phosphate dependent enzyme [Deltaproteobacteria bacterium]|nr:pyridoxal-phosphate dependent enzyme [Deltaproteobacteria bacterium]
MSGRGPAGSILECVGSTPLVELKRLGSDTGARFLVKVEAQNPGGSVKDRIAMAMVTDAEREGRLRPGGTIIEATAGNTGVGLALVAAVRGYRCIFVLPDKMSREKIALLEAYGAETVIVPTSVAPDSPHSYNSVADRLAREIPGAFRPSQFSNPSNPDVHYRTTGPEIWEATGGKLDAFVAGAGTGGTISGVGRFLKEKNPAIRVVLADPEGSILSGDAPRSYKVEGIGEDFIPATFDRQAVDDFVRVPDRESFRIARRLAREEGILSGGSSGTALAGALRYAERLPRGATLVVLLPDTGRNYLSKMYSDDWLREQGLLDGPSPARKATLADLLARKAGGGVVLAIDAGRPIRDAIRMMKECEVSQLPVTADGRVVGQVDEVSLLQALNRGGQPGSTSVRDAMGLAPPALEPGVSVEEAFRVLLSGHSGILVAENGEPRGFVTRIDLVRFWAEAGT